MSLVPSTANADGWVQIPCTLSNGLTISKPVILNFDSGAQLSAIGVAIAKQAGISKNNIVGSQKVLTSIGPVTLPVAEVVLSIAGGPRFRTRMTIDSQSEFSGVIGRNDLNTTHSICFDKNGAVQLFPLGSVRKVASAAPLQYWPGTVNGTRVNFLFDTGSVGSAASSAISQTLADAAGVTNYVGTEGTVGVGPGQSQSRIALVTLSINNSPPFQAYVAVDPALSFPALISRQDITRIARVCITPDAYTYTPLAIPQVQPQVTPMSSPPTQQGAPEQSPQPRKMRPVMDMQQQQLTQNLPVLIVGAGAVLLVAVLLFRH
jgi:hypothetical protein